MSVALLESTDTTARFSPPVQRRGERRLLCGPATWEQFKTLQNYFEQWGGGRVSYLDGDIQIMTLSLEHESRKSLLGMLVEVYLFEEEIDFFGHASTTLESELQRAGKEPDESYCFHTQKKIPDLVIEIAITRGGLDTLEIYRRWKIAEVWIWQRNALHVFHYSDAGYTPAPQSRHFPELDLALLAKCARIENFRQARKQFLTGLKKKRRR